MAASLSSKQNQMETTVNPLQLTERHFIPKIPLAESRKRKKCVCCNAIANEKIQPIIAEFVMSPYVSSPVLNFITQRRISKVISSIIMIIVIINYMHHSAYLAVFHSLSFTGIF